EDPCERERRPRHVEPMRDRAEPLDHHPPARELPALEPVDLASVIGGGELRGCEILPAQESRSQGPVGQERDPTLPAQRQLPLLYIPVEQVVRPLIGGHGRYFQGLRQLSGGGVAEADRQRLAFFLQRVELLEAPLPAVERFVQLTGLAAMARENWASLKDMDLRLTVSSRRVAPDHATEFGAFEQSWRDSSGVRRTEFGRYVAFLLRQADGSWRMDRFFGFEDSTRANR